MKTNKEIAKQYCGRKFYKRGVVNRDVIENAMIYMGNKKDKYYEPLIDALVKVYEVDCEKISTDISKVEVDWCQKHCTNLTSECIYKWLEIKNTKQ